MGNGRIYNNSNTVIRDYYHKLEENKYEDLENKDPYFQRMYRASNTTYPDILYENLPYKQQRVPQAMVHVNRPIPPSDATRTELTFAEPSNIVTDNIMYEDGHPDLQEDLKITRVLATSPAGGGNTVITTEYAPGLNEKLRRENPVVVSKPVRGPDGSTARKVGRLAPRTKTTLRRFNKDFDQLGRPLQIQKPVYDTIDFLKDLDLHYLYEDIGEETGQGSRLSNDSRDAFEDFIVRGKLRQGYEILPDE